MKTMISILWCTLFLQAGAGKLPLLKQEVHYQCKEATEVFMVWAVNGWKLPEETSLPEGSFVKNNTVFSPMQRADDQFSLKLRLQPGTQLDFIFYISRGPGGIRVDTWDHNRSPLQDYHLLVSQDNVATLPATVKLSAKGLPGIIDLAGIIFFAVLAIALCLFVLRKLVLREVSLKPGLIPVLGSLWLAACLMMVLSRSATAGIAVDIYLHPFKNIPLLISSSYYDLLYMLVLLCFFSVCLVLFRKNVRLCRISAVAFVCICLMSVTAAVLNIRIVEVLGKPLNYQWLYYTGFLRNTETQQAISEIVTGPYLIKLLAICGSTLLLAWIFSISFHLILQQARLKRSVALAALLLTSTFFIAGRNKGNENDYNRLANPVVSFIGSLVPFSEAPDLFSMEVHDSLKNVLQQKAYTTHKNYQIKNVLIYVMASTPAKLLDTYGSSRRLTPNIQRRADHSWVIENVYAASPAGDRSLVSLLCGVYPWISGQSILAQQPDINLPSISSELKKAGFRTGFFSTAHHGEEKFGEFLSRRDFDRVGNASEKSCEPGGESLLGGHMTKKRLECAAGEMLQWIGKDKNHPFLAVMWSNEKAGPATASNNPGSESEEDFSLYEHIWHADSVFGSVMQKLEEQGLSDSTLVVVLSDHGASAGSHHHSGGATVYEDYVRIPCIFMHPSFSQKRWNVTGSMVDIVPSIFDLLGQRMPESWQGESLVSGEINNRAYFFAPWSEYLFGYREGKYKYIYNASRNTTEIYDLVKDPFEEKDLSFDYQDKARLSHQRLAGWAQSVNLYMEWRMSR